MKMIQFKDELVPLKQCKIGTVVGFDSQKHGLFQGHIVGFAKDDVEKLMLKIQIDIEEYTHDWYPNELLWNI
jgi:hypothetical protein